MGGYCLKESVAFMEINVTSYIATYLFIIRGNID